jgi:glutamyl-Q tRNA(Asp) synthetase
LASASTSRQNTAGYTGRFAPSPSGPLHFGSLIAALGSYLQAKSQAGRWLVRIEDIDTPRTQAGADSAILNALDTFGLHWDGEVWYQSQRLERYQSIFQQLRQQGLIYGCQCSRKQISEAGGIYPGTCQQLGLTAEPLAWRLNSPSQPAFTDRVFGHQRIDSALAAEHYVLKRRDGLFSYQLVVVVDDWDQGVTEVIRGADLLTMTSRQLHLLQLLGAPVPDYGHLPLAVSAPGLKLSKQNYARPLLDWPLSQSMAAALTVLGHPPPAELSGAPVAELLAWALRHWQLSRVPAQQEVLCPEFA